MRRFGPLIFCIALFLSLWDSACLERREAALSEKVLRLHVRADGNGPAAQGRKLLVRDTLALSLSPLLSGSPDRDAAAERVKAALPELQLRAEAALEALGEPERVRLSLRREAFPARSYPGVTLPAGEYLALRADLGAAGGKNWWCVVWPPLCLAVSEEETEDAWDAFSPGERKLMTDRGVVLRSRLLEWFRRVFGVGS